MLEKIKEFLLELVSIDTSEGEDAGIYYVEDRFRELGINNIALQYIDDKALNLIINDIEKPDLLIATHIDTIPPRIPLMVLGSDKIKGTGAIDAKGSIAAIYALFLRNIKLPSKVSIAIFSGEETTSSGCYKYLDNHNPQNVLVMEPTDLNLALGSYGYVEVDVFSYGYGRHPDLFSNLEDYEEKEDPVRKIIKFLTHIDSIAKTFNTRYSITKFEAKGDVYSTPSMGIATLNILVPPGVAVLDIIRNTLRESEKIEGIEVKINDYWESYTLNAEKFMQVLVESYIEAFREKPRNYVMKGWTDASLFTKRGIPSSIFGPGKPELAHTVDEVIDIRDIMRASDFLERLIEKFR